MGLFHEVDPADRVVARAETGSGLIVRIGPDSYSRNDCIKIADPFPDWRESGPPVDAEWILELRRPEVHELVRMLMAALDDF
jgi:hypothetical protein